MCRQWFSMETERSRLHEIALRHGLGYEGTLWQSRLLDELVVAYMRKKNSEKEEGLRQCP